MANEPKLSKRDTLDATVDLYNGVSVDSIPELYHTDPTMFREILAASMKKWRKAERRGVWLRIPRSASVLVPVAVEQGFWYHHAGPDYLTLCNWLRGGRDASRLPAAASHYIGVAGFVLNSRREVLCVQEKTGPAASIGLWKLPGGLVDQGENISKAVLREVWEETGIDCDFLRLAAVIESHSGRGPSRESASDLYCVCVLKALDENQQLVPQEEEIERCAWIPIHEVLKHPLYAEGSAFGESYRAAMRISENRGDGLSVENLPVGYADREASVLHVSRKISSL
eukprot:g1151.t1